MGAPQLLGASLFMSGLQLTSGIGYANAASKQAGYDAAERERIAGEQYKVHQQELNYQAADADLDHFTEQSDIVRAARSELATVQNTSQHLSEASQSHLLRAVNFNYGGDLYKSNVNFEREKQGIASGRRSARQGYLSSVSTSQAAFRSDKQRARKQRTQAVFNAANTGLSGYGTFGDWKDKK